MASRGVNKAVILGNVGDDPSIRYMPNGKAVANFTVATSESWKDQQGQKQERTEWHRVVVWGKLAELCGKYLAKGRQVYVEGRLKTRKWQDNNGQDRYTTEIQGDNLQMLGGRNQEMGGYAPAQSAPQPSYQSRPAQSAPAPQAEPPMDAFDDNIPF